MKGVSVSLLLLGLVLGSSAESSLKNVLDLVADKANLAKELEKISLAELRVGAGKLRNDFNKALDIAKKIAAINGILDESYQLKPKFEKLSAELGSLFTDVEMDVNKLPDLTGNMDDWLFLNQCVEDARNTDFDKIKDLRNFLNEVFRQVFVCQVSGIQFAFDLVDLTDISGDTLTKQIVGERLLFLEDAVVEMAHLLKFQNDFVIRVISDYATHTHNELVHGLIDGGHKPSPSPATKDSSEEDNDDDTNVARGGRKAGGNGKSKSTGGPKSPKTTPAGPKITRPPKGSSEEDDDDDDDDDDERTLILRVLNILRGGKNAGGNGKSKPTGKPKITENNSCRTEGNPSTKRLIGRRRRRR
ncbi:uncharacterized protein LOC117331764 isoform X2 [Pecten maximus]|nr:uncharacterized protein LOC117331764 isoform X2 [Pecten maximus]